MDHALWEKLRWFHRSAFIAVALLYYPFVLFLRPAGGFFGNHFTDFLAGIVLPSALLSFRVGDALFGNSFRSFSNTMVTIFLAGIVWEVLAPIFDSKSVGDWRDMAAYLAGGFVYYGLRMAALKTDD